MQLNDQLLPDNSPIALNQGQISSFAFDYNNEAGVISTTKIRDAAINNAKIGTAAIGTANIGTLSFNEISGGTATLGGTTNGNGLMSVRNAGGSEVVKIDNTGIAVTGGSISINNSLGSAVLDKSGVVSTTTFTNGMIDWDKVVSTTGTTFGTATSSGDDFDVTFSVDRSTNVLIGANIIAEAAAIGTNSGHYVFFRFVDGTTVIGPQLICGNGQATVGGQQLSLSSSFIQNFAAGTHTVHVEFRVNSTDNTRGYIHSSSSGYDMTGGKTNQLWYIILGT